MPDLNGRESLARLWAAAATRDIPVFLLTAKVQALESQQYGGMVRGTIEKRETLRPPQLGSGDRRSFGLEAEIDYQLTINNVPN